MLQTDYETLYNKFLFDEIKFSKYEKKEMELHELIEDIRRNNLNDKFSMIHKIFSKEGDEYIVELSLYPIYAKNKKFNGIILVFRDITDQMLINDSMYETETKFRAIFENTNYGILIYDNGIITECNQACTRLFKCKKEQIVGNSPAYFSPLYQPDGKKIRRCSERTCP